MKLLSTLLIAILLAGAAIWPAHSQQACLPEQAADETMLKEFGELPEFEGHAEKSKSILRIYVKPDRSTWTIMIIADGAACVAAAGVGWTYTVPGKKA